MQRKVTTRMWNPHPETLVRYNDGVWCITHWCVVPGSDSYNLYRLDHRFGPRNGLPDRVAVPLSEFEEVSEMEVLAIAASVPAEQT